MSSARAFSPSPTLAPWAEIVPGAGPMTVEDLLARQDDGGWRYEVVEGVLFRVAGSGQEATNKPIPFVPDLAVEVASPTQGTHELAAKATLYLRGGTRLVWIVCPGTSASTSGGVGASRPRPRSAPAIR